MNKKSFCLLAMILAGSKFAAAQDQDSGLGLGFILGSPTGININWAFDENQAWDLQFGWSRSMHHLNLSYQVWNFRAFNVDGVILDWYYGAGLHSYHRNRYRAEDKEELGLRVPLGIAHQLRDFPSVCIYGELGPTLNLVDESSFVVDFGVGVRFRI